MPFDQTDHQLLPELVSPCKQRLASGASQEAIIGFLRDKTSSKVTSVRVLQMIYPVNISHTKEIVDHSLTWKDRKDADDDLHRTLERLQGQTSGPGITGNH